VLITIPDAELQAAAELTKKKEKEEKQTAQVGTLGMSSLSQLLESLMEKEQAVHASTKNKKVDTKMKQQMAYVWHLACPKASGCLILFSWLQLN